MNSHKCETCKIDVHRASFAKHLKFKKHLENEKQNELFVSERLFQESFENKPRKTYNPKPLREIARDKNRLDDNQVFKKMVRKMINPRSFTDRALQFRFDFFKKPSYESYYF